MRGRFEKPCYIYGRKLPTSSGIWSLFYSLLVCCCAYCKYVSFQLSFFLWGGEGVKARARVHLRKKRGRWIQSILLLSNPRVTQYVYIYIVYMWWKCVGFLCDTTFYLYYGSTFSVSMFIFYFNLCFLFDFVLVITCICCFLYFLLFVLFVIARFITFAVQ